jgi:hypothetical protein
LQVYKAGRENNLTIPGKRADDSMHQSHGRNVGGSEYYCLVRSIIAWFEDVYA